MKILWNNPQSVEDVQSLVQTAIDLEFATLPPYLYAIFTILPGQNEPAYELLHSIIMQEMIHMCLACNIKNAIGGTPLINSPTFPGPLPGGVDGTRPIHLYPFSSEAIEQGMHIEQPEEPIDPPMALDASVDGDEVTIGEYYHRVELALKALPSSAWTAHRHQIDDSQYFQGQLFEVNNFADAQQAIENIVSEGEGTPVSPDNAGSPLDFQNELAHYYRFWEIEQNKVLTKANNSVGYQWGPATLGVDWRAVYPAVTDPQTFDFSGESQSVQDAQYACNLAYTNMIKALSGAFNGQAGQLGVAIRAMFDLRMSAKHALQTPMSSGFVAGPAFLDLSKSIVSDEDCHSGGGS